MNGLTLKLKIAFGLTSAELPESITALQFKLVELKTIFMQLFCRLQLILQAKLLNF